VYDPAPNFVVSAERISSATVAAPASCAATCSRSPALMVNSRPLLPKVEITGSRMPAPVRVERSSSTCGAFANSTCNIVPPVNSMLWLKRGLIAKVARAISRNATVAPTAMRQKRMKS
jgi:hypothetical protein